MAASATLDTSVEIDGQLYSLNKIPSESSAVVLLEKENILDTIDFEALVTDLGRVGEFIHVAYNGVGAAGPRFTAEQIEIQQLGYDITRLCDKSVLTLDKFKKASRSIVINMQSTYAYLLDNFEKFAMNTLAGVSRIAKHMEEAALELHNDFESEEKKVVAILTKTQAARGEQAEKIISKKDELVGLEAKRKIEEQMIMEKQAQENEAKRRRKKLEWKEDKAVAHIGEIGFLRELVNYLAEKYEIMDEVFSIDGPEKKAEAIRNQRLEALEAEEAIRDKRHEAIVKMSSFAVKIKQCRTEENMAECAVDALHHAAGALKHLSSVMRKAAQFWQLMQEYCNSLDASDVHSQVETSLDPDTHMPKEERLRLWTSVGFKQEAIKHYAGWVALHVVCTTYMKRIKMTQQELYKYLTENPTWEQSRKDIKELAAKLFIDLQQDDKANSEKKLKAQEKIRALKDRKELE